MYAYLKAESIKLRHTSIRILAVVIPLSILALSYVLANQYFLIDNYNWWYIMINPFLVTLLAGMIYAKDSKLNQRAVRSLPVSLKKIWYAKVIHGVSLVALSALLILIGSEVMIHLLFRGDKTAILQLTTGEMFVGSLLIGILSAWQIPFCMLLYRKTGMFLMIVINVLLNIGCATLTSTLSCWYLFPHSYIARVMIPVLHILPNGLIAAPGSLTYSEVFLNPSSVVIGVVCSLLLFVVFTVAGAICYERSEAK